MYNKMISSDDLLDDIFNGKKPAFYPEFEGWVRDSRRFRAFARTYRAKIRAKLKHVAGDDGAQDLCAELETAALLLREERFTVEYEKYAASKHRSPDFTVTYKTHTPFNVEVRRIRSTELEEANTEARVVKLMAVLLDKVGQMQPGIVNLLWLTSDREISEADLTRATATLRRLAGQKVEELFTRRGFAITADFLKHHGQMSGIVLHHSGKTAVWLNPAARNTAPREIVTAIERLAGS